MIELATIAFLLIAGHFVMDYPLQGDFLANAKVNGPLRLWHLFGHSVMHGLAVYLVTTSLFLALLELVAHMVIDELKVKGHTSFAEDQALHVACKGAWLGLYAAGLWF